MGKIKLNLQADTFTTSYHLTDVVCDPNILLGAFPKYIPGDYKYSRKWVFEMDFKVFTLYDWKSTNLYATDLPFPSEFWTKSKSVTLHIGSRDDFMIQEFKQALLAELDDYAVRNYLLGTT